MGPNRKTFLTKYQSSSNTQPNNPPPTRIITGEYAHHKSKFKHQPQLLPQPPSKKSHQIRQSESAFRGRDLGLREVSGAGGGGIGQDTDFDAVALVGEGGDAGGGDDVGCLSFVGDDGDYVVG